MEARTGQADPFRDLGGDLAPWARLFGLGVTIVLGAVAMVIAFGLVTGSTIGAVAELTAGLVASAFALGPIAAPVVALAVGSVALWGLALVARRRVRWVGGATQIVVLLVVLGSISLAMRVVVASTWPPSSGSAVGPPIGLLVFVVLFRGAFSGGASRSALWAVGTVAGWFLAVWPASIANPTLASCAGSMAVAWAFVLTARGSFVQGAHVASTLAVFAFLGFPDVWPQRAAAAAEGGAASLATWLVVFAVVSFVALHAPRWTRGCDAPWRCFARCALVGVALVVAMDAGLKLWNGAVRFVEGWSPAISATGLPGASAKHSTLGIAPVVVLGLGCVLGALLVRRRSPAPVEPDPDPTRTSMRRSPSHRDARASWMFAFALVVPSAFVLACVTAFGWIRRDAPFQATRMIALEAPIDAELVEGNAFVALSPVTELPPNAEAATTKLPVRSGFVELERDGDAFVVGGLRFGAAARELLDEERPLLVGHVRSPRQRYGDDGWLWTRGFPFGSPSDGTYRTNELDLRAMVLVPIGRDWPEDWMRRLEVATSARFTLRVTDDGIARADDVTIDGLSIDAWLARR